MIELKFPDTLKDLPVSKSILNGELDLDQNFVLIAHTGSGKTMGIPPAKAAQGYKVILRQPTRQTCKLTYLGLNMFWGDQLKIGMHTSEETHGSLDECDIMVCTDGVMKNWLRFPKYKICVIFDEYHWQIAQTEIEASLVKTYLNDGIKFNIILLSATIRPSNIINYFENLNDHPASKKDIDFVCDLLDDGDTSLNTTDQKQWLKCYYSEGVAYPIENHIIPYIEDTPADRGSVLQFAERMLEEGKRGLVFLCTRSDVQNAKDLVQDKIPGLPVEFAHADVKIETILKFVDDNEPSVLFATVSLATSATLPFDEVLIVDRGIDTVYENGVEKQVTDIPIDNNGALQRRGRVGRVKPGVCTLATTFRESWDDIRPTQITPPLEKVAPIEAAMVCAQYELDPRRLDTLSNLDDRDIDRSVRLLKKYRAVYEDENEQTLKLTSLGRKISAIPLEIKLAVMVAQCPDELLPAVIAIASCEAGVYGMFQQKVRMPVAEGEMATTVHGSKLLDPGLVCLDSTLITKAKIIQAAYKAQDENNKETTLPAWAEMNGMWPEKIKKILFKYFQICNKGLKKNMKKMKTRFLEMDIDDHTDAIIKYLFSLNTFETGFFEYSEYRGKPGFKGDHFGYFTILDGTDIAMLGLDTRYENRDLNVMGTTKIIKPKKSNSDICIFGDTTIIPEDWLRDGGY